MDGKDQIVLNEFLKNFNVVASFRGEPVPVYEIQTAQDLASFDRALHNGWTYIADVYGKLCQLTVDKEKSGWNTFIWGGGKELEQSLALAKPGDDVRVLYIRDIETKALWVHKESQDIFVAYSSAYPSLLKMLDTDADFAATLREAYRTVDARLDQQEAAIPHLLAGG